MVTNLHKPLDEQIDEIMDWFDFSKVAKTMEALKWEWWWCGIPSEPEIRESARESLHKIARDYRGLELHGCTGGFDYGIDNWGQMYLRFVVSDWKSEDHSA